MYKRINDDATIKKILLEELLDFDHICKENGIKYSLMYGTLLGAIRHKGFIPWDDDIDIFILRSDFEELCRIIKNDEKYGVLSASSSKNYNSIIPKFYNKKTRIIQKREGKRNNTIENASLGLYLDLFVLDDLSNNSIARKLTLVYHDFLQLLWSFAYFTPNEKHSRMINSTRKVVNKTNLDIYLARYIDKHARKTRKNAKYCCNLLKRGFNKRETYVMEKSNFNSLIPLEFEGHKLLALADYDYWLNNEYGDYMKLPPVEKQVSNHDFVAFYEI